MFVRKEIYRLDRLKIPHDPIPNFWTHAWKYMFLRMHEHLQSFHWTEDDKGAYILCSTPNFSAMVVNSQFLNHVPLLI